MLDLHNAIMNIQATPGMLADEYVSAYKMGHKDARHAAAELAATHAGAAAEPVAWTLQWPSDSRINVGTVFDTEIEAKEYADKCDSVVVVPLYSALAALAALTSAPAEPVVRDPECEYIDELIFKLECFIDHATGGKLSKSSWALETLKAAHDEHVKAREDAAVAEVAETPPAAGAIDAREQDQTTGVGRRDPIFEANFPAAAGCWDGTGYTDHRICYASAGWRAALASREGAAQAVADGSTPGVWFVRKRERDGELLDCFIAAPDCNGFAYDAEILGDDEYREDEGMARKLADCELICKLVNGHRAALAATPAPSASDWRLDHSAGRPILVYQNCSVIEAENAEYVLRLIAADQSTEAEAMRMLWSDQRTEEKAHYLGLAQRTLKAAQPVEREDGK